jgi:hypothetical protein
MAARRILGRRTVSCSACRRGVNRHKMRLRWNLPQSWLLCAGDFDQTGTLENGTLRPVVGKELPLAEAARAHKEILEPGSAGKIVLIC